jgi:23S rRNA (adenine2503-C2)-methyltransferase
LNKQNSFFEVALEELSELLQTWGEPPFRARQLWHNVYKSLLDKPEEMTDIPRQLQRRISETFTFTSLETRATALSSDGDTEKVLFALASGHTIESVLMRYKQRRTACISTQVGCAMGCVFCATGQMGFERNLTAGEIVEQVIHFARYLAREDQRLTNVVIMGMGEPFHNYQATMQAIQRLNEPTGFKFGARRFTISTIGLVPMIKQFTRESLQVNLAVSLHAATNELRNELIPINRRYPLEELLPACREYVQQTGRRITFEWALIHDVNDSLDQAQELVEIVQGLNCHVNLIPLNPTQGYVVRASSQARVEGFYSFLDTHHIPCTVRLRRGVDISAGCGQLATENETKSAQRDSN